jgi:hypothetical protein
MDLLRSFMPVAGRYLRSGIELLPVCLYNFISNIGIGNPGPGDGTDYADIRDIRAYRQEK